MDIVSNWIVVVPNSEYIGSGSNTYPSLDEDMEIVVAVTVSSNEASFLFT